MVVDYSLCGQKGCLQLAICMFVNICVHGPVHMRCIVSCFSDNVTMMVIIVNQNKGMYMCSRRICIIIAHVAVAIGLGSVTIDVMI